MTVKELIETLKDYNEESKVVIVDWGKNKHFLMVVDSNGAIHGAMSYTKE